MLPARDFFRTSHALSYFSVGENDCSRSCPPGLEQPEAWKNKRRPMEAAGDIPGGGKYMRKWVKEGMWDDSVRETKSFGSGEPGF